MTLVDPRPIASYARLLRDAELVRRAESGVAAPLFATILASECFLETLAPVLESPGLVALVHVAHEVEIGRQLRVGDEVSTTAEIVGVRRAAGSALVDVEVKSRVGDDIAATAVATLLAVGYEAEQLGKRRILPRAPARGLSQGAPLRLAADEAERYAAVSGDHNPIHLEPEAARAAGFDHVVVHGMCLLAHAVTVLTGLVAAGDPDRIRRVAARFVEAVAPGERLEVVTWAGSSLPYSDTFVVERGDGTTVLRGQIGVAHHTSLESERRDDVAFV